MREYDMTLKVYQSRKHMEYGFKDFVKLHKHDIISINVLSKEVLLVGGCRVKYIDIASADDLHKIRGYHFSEVCIEELVDPDVYLELVSRVKK